MNRWTPDGEPLYVLDENGERVRLRHDQERPDMEAPEIESYLVDLAALADRYPALGIRLALEGVLARSCGGAGPDAGELSTQDAAAVLIKIATAGPDVHTPAERRGAVAALGRYPTAEASAFLTGMLNNRRSPVEFRAAAASALGDIGGRGSAAALERALGEAEPAVRGAAARGLGRSGALAALPALESVVRDDTDPTVAMQAYAAIDRLNRHHVESLIAVKQPGRPRRRRIARDAPRDALTADDRTPT